MPEVNRSGITRWAGISRIAVPSSGHTMVSIIRAPLAIRRTVSSVPADSISMLPAPKRPTSSLSSRMHSQVPAIALVSMAAK